MKYTKFHVLFTQFPLILYNHGTLIQILGYLSK
jgi:hypothetical protein